MMPRGLRTFRQKDVTRLLRAAKAASCTLDRVEIFDRSGNRIIAVVARADDTVSIGSDNEWDAPAGEHGNET
jgi:hypothetical protein